MKANCFPSVFFYLNDFEDIFESLHLEIINKSEIINETVELAIRYVCSNAMSFSDFLKIIVFRQKINLI